MLWIRNEPESATNDEWFYYIMIYAINNEWVCDIKYTLYVTNIKHTLYRAVHNEWVYNIKNKLYITNG